MIPDHYSSNLNLAGLWPSRATWKVQSPSLQKAASLRPTLPEPHIDLSQVYARLGTGRRMRSASERRPEAWMRYQPFHLRRTPMTPRRRSKLRQTWVPPTRPPVAPEGFLQNGDMWWRYCMYERSTWKHFVAAVLYVYKCTRIGCK